MNTTGQIRADAGASAGNGSGAVELAVPYTDWSIAAAVLSRAAEFASGLNAHVSVIAVHTVPYPSAFGGVASVHAHLVEQLVDLASRSPIPVSPQIVMARSREEGFLHALPQGATVLIGTRRHWWRTEEEKLARLLARDGYHVLLVQIDQVTP